MSATESAVVDQEGVIVPPKQRPEQMNFRWPPDLIEEVKAIAMRTGRSINEAGELLMRWAVERAKTELELTGEVAAEPRRKKQ